MQTVVTTERVPIKIWATNLEDDALAQAKAIANLPFVHRWVSLMPDAHVGYGMPIGGVVGLDGVICPNFVGVDIGCGMIAARTALTDIDADTLKSIMGKIRKLIPVGFAHHQLPQTWQGFDQAPEIEIIEQELPSARHQLGTLGGGNHFLEIQRGSDGYIWVMIHSGSRNFGLKIAKTYHTKALNLCKQWYAQIPNDDLAYLPLDTIPAKEYIACMQYALDFAKASRMRMMELVSDAFELVQFDTPIDVHHNYARFEHHYGANVMVHRKGATSARAGELGIIPGSQGTASYIVRGKGNPESFTSCSHGAGRALGRKAACRTLDLATEIKRLDDQGIIHGIRNIDDLDEAAGAYKDIDVVMANQADLVDIVVKLTPLGVIKG